MIAQHLAISTGLLKKIHTIGAIVTRVVGAITDSNDEPPSLGTLARSVAGRDHGSPLSGPCPNRLVPLPINGGTLLTVGQIEQDSLLIRRERGHLRCSPTCGEMYLGVTRFMGAS